MRKFTFNRKTVYVTEKEYRALLARWDVSKAEDCEINIVCTFCKIYPKCFGCPLAVFESLGTYGCVNLAIGLVRKHGNLNDYKYIHCGDEAIHWNASVDKQARRAVNAIRKGIESAVKVRGRSD